MTTFAKSGVEFKVSSVTTTVQRANVLINADKSPMSYKDICDGLYAGTLNPSQLYRVVLAYVDGDTVKGIKLDNNRLSLAGQRDKGGKLVGAAKEAHSFVKNQTKLTDASTIKGTLTIGEKYGDLYFGYTQDGSDYNPCIASVSATYGKDAEAHTEITSLIAANPDHEIQVYYVPSPDFKAWCKFMKRNAAKSA